jgi:hypothetical protein
MQGLRMGIPQLAFTMSCVQIQYTGTQRLLNMMKILLTFLGLRSFCAQNFSGGARRGTHYVGAGEQPKINLFEN